MVDINGESQGFKGVTVACGNSKSQKYDFVMKK